MNHIMKRIELEKAFRTHVKKMHGEKALQEFAGSELEGLCVGFLQKQLKLFAMPDKETVSEPIQDALYATGALTAEVCNDITAGILTYLDDAGFEIRRK